MPKASSHAGFLMLALCWVGCAVPRFSEQQLTFGAQHHHLNHTQVFAPRDSLLVLDNRPHDSLMRLATAIGVVNIRSKEVKWVHDVAPHTGLGAATWKPKSRDILFLEGLANNPTIRGYSAARRTGKLLRLPDSALFAFDARVAQLPGLGQHSGGTHAHSWHPDGLHASSTYNDAGLEQLSKTKPGIANLRTVVVHWPVAMEGGRPNGRQVQASHATASLVGVYQDDGRTEGKLLKAFDECWLKGDGYVDSAGKQFPLAILFQGQIRENGRLKTEVFVKGISLPLAGVQGVGLTATADHHLPGQLGGSLERLTFSDSGVQGPRHWLRSSADGRWAYFLAKDSRQHIQVFGVHLTSLKRRQFTHNAFSVTGQMNISHDGRWVVYPGPDGVYVTHLLSGRTALVSGPVSAAELPLGPPVFSNRSRMIAFTKMTATDGQRYNQVFLLKRSGGRHRSGVEVR